MAFGAALHVVAPAFGLDERSVRRAGLDYWKDVDVHTYDTWEEYDEKTRLGVPKRYFFSTKGPQGLESTEFLQPGDLAVPEGATDGTPFPTVPTALVFGSETAGLYELIGGEAMAGHEVVRIPMFDKTRSLNLSTTAGMVLWEYWRQYLQCGGRGSPPKEQPPQ